MVYARGEGALQRKPSAERAACLCFGVNQIGNRLRLSQVELIVEKRALENPRVSNAQARKGQDAFEQQIENDRAAVPPQLEDVRR